MTGRTGSKGTEAEVQMCCQPIVFLAGVALELGVPAACCQVTVIKQSWGRGDRWEI